MMKMERLKFFLMVFCLFVAGAGCSDDDDEPVVLTPEKTTVTLSGEGDSQTVGVSCNGKWTAVSSAEWCKVTAEAAGVVISAEENATGAELKADVTLACGEVKAVIKVIQEVAAEPLNKVFAATTQRWYFDFNGFEGAYKTAYEASKEGLVKEGWGESGNVLKEMSLTQGAIAFLIHDEDMKGMGAPEENYVYNGTLLLTIEAVEGSKDQIAFKGIKADPEATEDYGEYWYGEDWGCAEFRDFVNTLMVQNYTITADNVAAPKVLTFTGVTDTGSVVS